MTESLIIHLRDGAAPQWMVCNDDGHVVVNAVSGELAQATAMSTGRRVAVILPASEVLATDSDAPAKGAAKLAQVIPFALEERVADEIENLHFAIGDRDAVSGRVPVAVIARSLIDARLAELRAAGLDPQAIYSESTLLPAMPGQMIALLDGDTLTLRTADAPPLVLPALSIGDAFEMALSMQSSAVAGLEPAPLGLLLYAGHDEWQAHQSAVEAFRERFTGMKVQLLPSGPLSVLAPAAASGDAVNLLQGALAVTSSLEVGWRSWRVAAVLAASLLCLHLGARGVELNRLRKTEASLDAGIQQAFRAAMPGQQNAINARGRVAKRLDEIHSGGAGGALLPALSAIASARGAAPDATIEGINFRDGTLDLRMLAPSAASLDSIGQQLRAAAWQADVMELTASGDSYRGRLQIRKAGA
ncbi:MAG TPA: type II secretion system protein GspL [Steroidobacteraceae bacterium]|jgi:general secretion pathway protein L|nr:type II secretion system protein GspL [Steroidobacteraceae bacterium]